ncbi:glycosyltransferase family 2 protein [Lewinella cohaerens]|uniref:glycosyltransferase family 2 protein n=1 Tax=Lewinella cohaerens TaxID=70995 RepID=UPI00036AC804|nr:glycosyltransferase family 2 protein [Lewinella cohaerens]
MSDELLLTVILPAYNEAKVIGGVIDEIQSTLPCRIVVVDDGSSDNTIEYVREKGVMVIRHLLNRGAGASCMTGISLARENNWQQVAFLDADGQHVATDLLVLQACMKETEADLVIGSRFMHAENRIPRIRRIFNAMANILTNTFCKHHYSDTQSGFRLLNRRAIEAIDLYQDDFSYCSEMIIQAEQADLKISECPIFVRYTEYSMSKGQDFQVGVMTAFHFLWKLIFK